MTALTNPLLVICMLLLLILNALCIIELLSRYCDFVSLKKPVFVAWCKLFKHLANYFDKKVI